ncbi:WG repeat-containing protein [Lacihabitans lacunae]|uniref:WG repeat-containing protein n=1 Tax=Lacihabitans lacunae TaxID=1028214 RepID=A0ABV7YW41_9BACT
MKNILIIIFLFLEFKSTAQKISTFRYSKVYFNDEWRFIDQKGDFFLEKEIGKDKIENLCVSNGLAITFDGTKYGFMDFNGIQIVPNMYEDVSCFQFGFASAKINQRWGLIDMANIFVIDPKYDLIGPVGVDGVVPVVNNEKLGLIDTKGYIISDFKYSWFPNITPQIIPPIFTNGLLPIFKPDSIQNFLNWKLGYIDSKGNLKINTDFEFRGTLPYFFNGRANVAKNGVQVVIDTLGNVIPTSKLNNKAILFHEGFSTIADENGKQGIINDNGQIILDPIYNGVNPFSEEFAAIQIGLNNTGGVISAFVNKKGEFVFDKKFGLIRDFNEGFAAVEVNGKWTYIDNKGNYLIEPQFDVTDFFSEGLGMFGVKKGKNLKFGFLNNMGKVVIEPIYNEVKDFKFGLAPVKVGNKFGFINNKGEMVIKPKFQNAFSFIEEEIIK